MSEIEKILELDIIKQQISSYCACSLGKDMVDEMEMYDDLEDLVEELKIVDEAMSLVYGYGRLPMGGLHDIRPYLQKARMDGILYPEELIRVADTLQACLQVVVYRNSHELEVPRFMELTSRITELKDLIRTITHSISRDGTVYDSASSELARIRKAIKQQSMAIFRKMNDLLSSEKDYLSENIITTRNDRYVLPVNVSYKNQVKGIIHAQSASNKSAYIEPESVVLMNNALQDERMKEQAEIERILFEITQKIKAHYGEIFVNIDIMKELDFIFAKATFGKERDCVVADVVDEYDCLEIIQARHPLIDPKKVVSNDIVMAKPYHILLITGSNTGGKTVTMKTVGLLSMMSLYGLPIPCNKATIPFFDSIYCDLGDGQSIAESLSTFSSHMKNIVNITDHVSHTSLVLIDEVGSGTDPREGECLAQAVLQYLHQFECITVASTHYSALKKYAKECEYVQFASVEFDLENMQPTYRLLNHMIGQSYAFEISKRLGLKLEIVEDANVIKEHLLSKEDQLLEKLEQEMENQRQLQLRLEAQLLEAKKEYNRLNHERKQLENKKEQLMEEAKKDADQYVEDKKLEVQLILDDLKSKAYEVKMHEVIDSKQQLEKLKSKKNQEVLVGDENFVFHVGDKVKVLSVNREAEVTEVSRGGLTISMGGLKMHVRNKEVVYIGKVKKEKVVSSKKSLKTSSTGHYECNVIGMRYVDAMSVVDKFLDDAIVHRYPHVRIVHGMGTGVLRNGIRKMLDKNKHVVSYRDGGPNEGGLGATLVYFE